MKKLCVFTGAYKGKQTAYSDAAITLGKLLAEQDIALLFGGGNVGLMGEIANATLAINGNAVGVMPQFLVDREISHAGLTELHIVNSMHERKALLAEMADGFVALPGGAGTMDELFEMWTWRRLHLHQKPIGLLNTAGYFDKLLDFLDHMATEGFVPTADKDLLIVENEPVKLIKRFLQVW